MGYSSNKLRNQISEVIVKTLLSIQIDLLKAYKE